jgi:NodT family efflux transporter outer membrane factor (OMF) lipoprotein
LRARTIRPSLRTVCSVGASDRAVGGSRARLIGGVIAAGLLLGGCAAGPDFVRPAPPSVTRYTPDKVTLNLDPGEGEPAQQLIGAQPIPAAWYSLFHSPGLDEVVRQALAGSPTIAAARATLAQAQQAVIQARGAYYPELDLAASAQRQQGPAALLGQQPGRQLPVYNLYMVGPLASFSPDVFGATARRVEQQKSLAQRQAFELAAAQLTVTGEVVTEAITIASARAQLDALNDIITDDEKTRALVQQKFEAGRAPRTDVLIAESQQANDRALLPPLQQQLAAAEDAMTALTGRYPAQWSPPAFALSDFTLPAELPVILPSALVHKRPDIMAAEAQLHAASAAVGVATAQMYPTVNLSASLESAATSPDALFQGSGLIWSVAGGLAAPIFHGGALKAQRQGAIEAFRASSASYRQVVLQAFGQVADTLRALDHDARLVESERNAFDIARTSVTLQRLGYDAGKIDILKLVDAERSYQQARIGYARAEAQRYLDSAQLFAAMGGGWSEDRALCGDCSEDVGLGDAAPGRGAPSSDAVQSDASRYWTKP